MREDSWINGPEEPTGRLSYATQQNSPTNRRSNLSEHTIQPAFQGRMTLQPSKAFKSYEITNENVDENPFEVAEDCENEISNDVT